MLSCVAGLTDPEYEGTTIFRNVEKYPASERHRVTASQRHNPKGWNPPMKTRVKKKFYLLSLNNVPVDGTGNSRLYRMVMVTSRLYRMVLVTPDCTGWYW